MKLNSYLTYILFGLLSFGFSTQILAQSEAAAATSSTETRFLWLILIAAIVIAFSCLILATAFLVLFRRYQAKTKKTAETSEELPSLSWKGIGQILTNAVPVTEEDSIDMGHNYDGIRELDNKLPPWWKYGFYASILFAFAYMYFYHFSDTGWSSLKEYEAEMAEAAVIKEQYLQKVGNMVNEENVSVLQDASDLAAGEKVYTTFCVACHGSQGEGGIGPNFADAYWIHGGSINDIFSIIKYGAPEKGMISWQSQLRPVEMQQVASYILSLQGSNPPNAKEPQGELYQPGQKTETEQEAVGSL